MEADALDLVTGPLLRAAAELSRRPAIPAEAHPARVRRRRLRVPSFYFPDGRDRFVATPGALALGHRHPRVELCTPLAGTPLLAVEGIIYRMSEGDLAVLPPAALHFECCDDPRRPYRLMWAVLGPGVSSVHVAEYSPRSGYRTLGHAVIGAGGPAAREVESLAAAGAWTRERSRGLRVALLALLSSSARFLASGGSAAAPGEAHAAVERARDFISRRYVERLSVADVAQAACLSPNYLSVLFREATGKTVLEAIHELKLAEAKARLRETDSPVKQIAFDLGFESPQYFSRFFSRETGQAPSAFRSRGRS